MPKGSEVKPVEKKIRNSKFFFDNTLVVIEIENMLFNVHKYQLMKSETFASMFATAKQDTTEGSSEEHPIVLQGVKASDFECLLTVLYATRFSTNQPAPEASLIIPAFRLANKWNFKDLRAFLLPLAEKELGDIDKIIFAREFDIKEWLAPAHIALCKRKEPLTTEEAHKIGIDSLLFIYRTREEHKPPPPNVEQNVDAGRNVCFMCLGMGPTYQQYSSGNATCSGCSNARFCFTRNNNYKTPAIDLKVKEWVQNGCKI